MAFKVSSPLVWLLATLAFVSIVGVQRAAAQDKDCTQNLDTCEMWSTCSECTEVDESSNQVYEECMASQLDYSNYCDIYLGKACCQHQASEKDCIANHRFESLWTCELDGCYHSYPSVESCSAIGVSVTSGDTTNTIETPGPAGMPVPVAVKAGEVTTITVSANAFDERTDADGCAPDGCTAGNTRDGDLTGVSRWSCSSELVEAGGGAAKEECQIVYEFSEAQDILSVAAAFLNGGERTRMLNININGVLHTVVESSGTTSGLETFELDAADGVLSLGLESAGLDSDEFLSIIEVEFQVYGVATSLAPTPVPMAATPAPVAVGNPAAAVTSAPIAEAASPVPTAADTTTRDIVITPSPTAEGTTVGSGAAGDVGSPAAGTRAPIAEIAAPGATATSTPAASDSFSAFSTDVDSAALPTVVISCSNALPTFALGLAVVVAAGL